MGGAVNRVIVLPLQSDDGSGDYDYEAAFRGFAVQHASCSMEVDTQRLLTCIETGFGDYTTFNLLVRRVFSERRSFIAPKRNEACNSSHAASRVHPFEPTEAYDDQDTTNPTLMPQSRAPRRPSEESQDTVVMEGTPPSSEELRFAA